MESTLTKERYSPTEGEVLGTTDARQANSRKMTFRILIFSTALIILIFAGFVFGFFNATPPDMDARTTPGVEGQASGNSPPATKPLPAVPGPSNPGSDTRGPDTPSP